MDGLKIRGIIRVYTYPQEWDIPTLNYWCCDERDRQGHLLHAPRMGQKAKTRYLVYETENLITNAGIANILTMLSAQPGNANWFSQVFSCGNYPITGVARTDTQVAGESGLVNNRKNAAGYSITGSQTDIAYVYQGGDANGPWTNVGLYGGGSATTTDGTGTLQTHAMFSYDKPNTQITVDYILSISN